MSNMSAVLHHFRRGTPEELIKKLENMVKEGAL